MCPITAHALGHFCINFKKIIFFEYLIMFRNFLALIPRILERRAHSSNPTESVSVAFMSMQSYFIRLRRRIFFIAPRQCKMPRYAGYIRSNIHGFQLDNLA